MVVKERSNLRKYFLRLRGVGIESVLRVRHALENLQGSLHASLAQLAMREHGEAEEQVARAAGQDGGREAVEVTVDGRKLRIFQVMPVGIKQRCMAQVAAVADNNVVQPLVRFVSVSGLRQIRPRRAGCDGCGQRQVFLSGS